MFKRLIAFALAAALCGASASVLAQSHGGGHSGGGGGHSSGGGGWHGSGGNWHGSGGNWHGSGGNWHGGGGNWHGGNWHGGNWHGNNWHGGNWHNGHHHNDNDVIFIGSFGFPWGWGWGWGPGWGWGYGYPYYGYYPYGYGGAYGYGYGGYGSGYGQGANSGSSMYGQCVSGCRALPMGARLRLKSGKDISGFPEPLRRVFQAMKTYGLIVADNGSDMYVSGTYDTRWDNDVLNPAFGAIKASDFEVVQLGWRPAAHAGRGRAVKH